MRNYCRKVFALVVVVCISLFTLSGCCLQHDWVEADCTHPKHCSKCDKTDGDPLGHKWRDATCTKPQKCSRCGETKGKPLGHNPGEWEVSKDDWTKEVRYCTVCGEEVDTRNVSDDGTIAGFIHAYNNIALSLVSDTDTVDGDSLEAFSDMRINYDDIDEDGVAHLKHGVRVDINPTSDSERLPSSDLEIVNFYVEDPTEDYSEYYFKVVGSVLFAACDGITEDQMMQACKYMLRAEDSPPEVDGYSITSLSVGSIMHLQIRVE